MTIQKLDDGRFEVRIDLGGHGTDIIHTDVQEHADALDKVSAAFFKREKCDKADLEAAIAALAAAGRSKADTLYRQLAVQLARLQS